MKKVLVFGSGPIIIGQGAEFDYSGTQACLAIKEEGHKVILLNNNPATIMTDHEIVDKVYSEPLTIEYVEKIINEENPDLILPTLGGQTGLNLAHELDEKGILDKYDIEVIGTSLETIQLAEDREKFKNFLIDIDQPVIESNMVSSVKEGLEFIKTIGYPAVVRPAYTLGGTGGGHVENEKELIAKIKSGTKLSIVNQVLIEKSVKGYKEIEYEVMRDSNGTCISVCNMENIDPVGIHTGDSLVVAPSQTLSDEQYQILRTASLDIVDKLDIKGGCNVQIALDPLSNNYYIIEVNPRVSRSSALASKATGYPIAKVATKIALGYDLHEIINDMTQKTYASFEPTLDYCVVKIPKWPFDKFVKADNNLGTMMRATGEVMAIGNKFEAAFLKALRALEENQYNLEFEKIKELTLDQLLENIENVCSERIFMISELIKREVSIKMISNVTKIDLFFLQKIKNIVDLEESIKNKEFNTLSIDTFKKLKKFGFSDQGIADLVIDKTVDEIIDYRLENEIFPSYKMVDTCGGEFEAVSPYYYSTYGDVDEVKVTKKEKILVLGAGPIRIGQGVEFDYSTVKSLFEISNLGYESIVVNNNPETVSTDFDMSDKLYFEPITKEDIINIIIKEKPKGVILQFGGQTSIKLAKFLKDRKINVYGTDYDGIHLVEERQEFINILEKNNILYPKGKGVDSLKEGLKVCNDLNFPLLVRPSYVLGGQGMKIVKSKSELEKYLKNSFNDNNHSVLIDEYLEGIELEIDAVTDGEDVFIPGIMQHLEKAGIHSGDSIAFYPAKNISKKVKEKIYKIAKKIAISIEAKGLINIQLIYYKDKIYVLEVNPRASRTVPFISKVTKTPLVKIATDVMLGSSLEKVGIKKEINTLAIKGPVFSMDKIDNAEIALGPEMKSTGEILSIDTNLNNALYKTFIAQFSKNIFDINNKILISLSKKAKDELKESLEQIDHLNLNLHATKGTYKYLKPFIDIEKYDEDIESFDVILNIPENGNDQKTDGFYLRQQSQIYNIPIMTSVNTIKKYLELYISQVEILDTKLFSI
ncbi:MAG: carbamoyl-phosphate synthase (glutamine-hydrolyzing) large subunit [Bacillota bacterium]